CASRLKAYLRRRREISTMADDNRTPGNDREPSGGGNWMKSLLIWAGILLALVLVVQTMSGGASQSRDAIAYSDFLTKVDSGQVQSVSIGKDSITGRLLDNTTIRSHLVPDPSLTQRLRDKNVRFDGQPEATT